MHKDDEVIELLSQLSSLDEVTAWIPTGVDHSEAVTPEWCELVLEVKREVDSEEAPDFPLNTRLPLRRHDGELIIECLWSVLHPSGGKSIIQMMWHELDQVVDRIQRRVDKGKEPLKSDRGEAVGLAKAIAIMTNPYAYDVDAVREEAMARYEARHA